MNISYLTLKTQAECFILSVTSRELVWNFLEQLGFDFVPIFHGFQGGPAAQHGLG